VEDIKGLCAIKDVHDRLLTRSQTEDENWPDYVTMKRSTCN